MTDCIINIRYGSIEPQIRYVPVKDGLKSQSRRIERDVDGLITLATEWTDLGTVIVMSDLPPESWWVKLSKCF